MEKVRVSSLWTGVPSRRDEKRHQHRCGSKKKVRRRVVVGERGWLSKKKRFLKRTRGSIDSVRLTHSTVSLNNEMNFSLRSSCAPSFHSHHYFFCWRSSPEEEKKKRNSIRWDLRNVLIFDSLREFEMSEIRFLFVTRAHAWSIRIFLHRS